MGEGSQEELRLGANERLHLRLGFQPAFSLQGNVYTLPTDQSQPKSA